MTMLGKRLRVRHHFHDEGYMVKQNPNAAQNANAAASVEAVVSALAQGWNRHDMTAFAAAFSENADFVNVIGMHWQGRQEIEAKHAQVHRTIFRNSRLRLVEQAVRFLSPTIALAHASWEMKGAETLPGWNAPETRRGIMTLVLTKEADRWLIAAAHNTDIIPVQFPET
jgi:uncharacterized protein (TIGR02246 family)